MGQKENRYYQKHRLECLARMKEYRLKHKKYLKEYHHQYYLNNIKNHKILGHEWRLKNKEYIKEHDKKYRQENQEQIKAYQKEWNKNNLDLIMKSKTKWMKKNPGAVNAHHAVNRALKNGKLSKSLCCQFINCNNKNVQAHHPDYSKPLEVIWLCPKHHKLIHSAKMSEDKP
jgi:hypothetical protein